MSAYLVLHGKFVIISLTTDEPDVTACININICGGITADFVTAVAQHDPVTATGTTDEFDISIGCLNLDRLQIRLLICKSQSIRASTVISVSVITTHTEHRVISLVGAVIKGVGTGVELDVLRSDHRDVAAMISP